ncbi:MAG: acetoacetate decarboxylase family protein [Halioglobus sp.]
MKQKDDAFFQVDQSIVTTSESDVALPMFFYDASSLLSLFHVDAGKLVDVIGDADIEPALDRKGRGIVGLAFYEYRDASIASYNEVGLAAQVVRKGDSHPRFPVLDMARKPSSRKSYSYVLHLPVTTELANAAGLEIWGFPKFVADIPLSNDGRRFNGAVIDPSTGTSILTYKGNRGTGLSLPGMDLRFYTKVEGLPMEIIVNTNYRGHSGTGGNMTLTIGESNHSMAEDLRKLDLDSKNPFFTHMADRFRARLNVPKVFSE